MSAASSSSRAVTLRIDWRPQSPNRWTEHWAARQRRHASAHKAFRLASEKTVPPTLPCVVTVTRVSHGRLDFDNCAAALKPIFDACADFLGCDDRDDRITWRVEQERTSEKVRVGHRNAFACFVCVRIEMR